MTSFPLVRFVTHNQHWLLMIIPRVITLFLCPFSWNYLAREKSSILHDSMDENSSNDSDETVVSVLIDLIITELESIESTISTVTVIDQTIKTSTRDVKLPTRILRSHVRQRFHPFELFHRQCRFNGKTIKRNDYSKEKSIDFDHHGTINDSFISHPSIENTDGDSSLSLPLKTPSLPPNKRRLREHHIESNATLTSQNDSNPVVQPLKKDVPTNSIEKYLRIRQQVCWKSRQDFI